MGELEQRLDLVYSARSKGELASVVKDLRPDRLASGTPTTVKDVGVLNGFVRKGRWLVGDRYRASVVVGTAVIDLREAQFTGQQTTLHVNSWVGTVYIVVPDDAEVCVAGTGILGGFEQDRESVNYSASVRINVTGIAFCGDVHVVHELPVVRGHRAWRRPRENPRRLDGRKGSRS